MIETHLFGNFVPPNPKYMLLGSFTAKKYADDPNYDWFYSSKRNQFWPIIETIYDIDLKSRKTKEQLFTELSIAVADVIHSCERADGNSLDANLVSITYNKPALEKIFAENDIQQIFFSSKFVEKEYKRHFKDFLEKFSDIKLITLPSPSPRYAAMRIEEKIEIYRDVFPKL